MKCFFLVCLLAVSSCDLWESDPVQQYTVVRGDTLTVIARAHGVSVAELLAWNSLKGDQIDVGQVLLIKGEAKVPVEVKTRAPKRPSAARPGARRMPGAKPCLAGPSLDDLDEEEPDIQASQGLSMAQIRGPMREALPGLSICFEAGWPEAVVDLEITVGCNGQVAAIGVLDGGGLADDVLRCMRETLRYVGFPAHDMPDGMQFRYPVTLFR
jgi:LysM repeat protein